MSQIKKHFLPKIHDLQISQPQTTITLPERKFGCKFVWKALLLDIVKFRMVLRPGYGLQSWTGFLNQWIMDCGL